MSESCYFRKPGREASGPCSRADIERWIVSGELTGDDEVLVPPRPWMSVAQARSALRRDRDARQDYSFAQVGCLLLAVFFFVAAVVALIPADTYRPTSYSHRFKDDNAMGATANALEFLARRQERTPSGTWCVAALLCVLIYHVVELRRSGLS